MKVNELIRSVQRALNKAGATLQEDGELGPNTIAALDNVVSFNIVLGLQHPNIEAGKEPPPWFKEAKKYAGKNEADPEFNKQMSSNWSLLGLNLGTIAKNWAAWCGLATAVALAGAGYKVQHDGAAARNWDKYGTAIEWKKVGIPKGAIVRINHVSNCASGANNHVTMSDGDCAASDLQKPGATFNGYGGNQGNAWKVSSFPAAHICSVRWPEGYPTPPVVEKSFGCSGKPSGDSTR